MSDTVSEGIYEPEDLEVNLNSKISIIQHVSHRLGESDCLGHEENGNMNRVQMLQFALGCLRYKYGLDPNSNRTAISNQLASLAEDTLRNKGVRMPFTAKKQFYGPGNSNPPGMSKTEYARIVAAILDFEWQGNDHIGDKNKVVSKTFFEDCLDSLDRPGTNDAIALREENEGLFKQLYRETELNTANSLYDRMRTNYMEDQIDWTDIVYNLVAIIVPTYQRHANSWTPKKHLAFVDSVLRDVPMPSIVLGRVSDSDPWQLIDGQQRLTTYKKYIQGIYTYHGLIFGEWPEWAKDRFREYQFNVEYIKANSDAELALIFERYNSSGKALNAPELRCARFHHSSALHHYIMAASGGPMLDDSISAQMRLGVSENLIEIATRAEQFRSKFRGISAPEAAERNQVRQSTIKTYDLLCKITAYCTYRSIPIEKRGLKNDTPSSAQACNAVLASFNHGSTAHDVVSRLSIVVNKAASIFGEGDSGLAFRKLKYFGPDEDTGREGGFYPHGGVQAWEAQLQCASLWNLSSRQLDLLELNAYTIREQWHLWATNPETGIIDVRQNSKTLWGRQDDWCKRLAEILEELDESTVHLTHLADSNTPPAVEAILSTLQYLYVEPESEEILNLRKQVLQTLEGMHPETHSLVIEELEKRD